MIHVEYIETRTNCSFFVLVLQWIYKHKASTHTDIKSFTLSFHSDMNLVGLLWRQQMLSCLDFWFWSFRFNSTRGKPFSMCCRVPSVNFKDGAAGASWSWRRINKNKQHPKRTRPPVPHHCWIGKSLLMGRGLESCQLDSYKAPNKHALTQFCKLDVASLSLLMDYISHESRRG